MKKITSVLCLLISMFIISCGSTVGQVVFDLEILNVESQEWTRVAEIKEREMYPETFSSTEEAISRVQFQLSNLSENVLIITEVVCEKEFVISDFGSAINVLPAQKVSFSVSAASFEIIKNCWIKVKYTDLTLQRQSDYFIIELDDFYNSSSNSDKEKITETLELKVDQLISLKDAFGFTGKFNYDVNYFEYSNSNVINIENTNYNSNVDYAYKDCYLFAQNVGEQKITISTYPEDLIVTVIVSEADDTAWQEDEWLIKYHPNNNETISSVNFEKYSEYIFEPGSFDIKANSLETLELFNHYSSSIYLRKEDNTLIDSFTLRTGVGYNFIPSESCTANISTYYCNGWIYMKYRCLSQLTAVDVVEEIISAVSGSLIPFNVGFTPDDDYSFTLEIEKSEIAAITSYGMIVPGAPGSTMVTVRSAVNHNLFDTFTLDVIPAVLTNNSISKGYFYGSSSETNIVNYTFTASNAGVYQFILEDRNSFVHDCSASAKMSILDELGNLVYKDLPAALEDSYVVTMSEGETLSIIVSSKDTLLSSVKFFNLSVIEKK